MVIFNVLGNEFRPVGISWFHNYTAFKSGFVIQIQGSFNHFTWYNNEIVLGTQFTKIIKVASCF